MGVITLLATSIIVLMGSSVTLKPKLKNLAGKYSFTRLRIWTAKNVSELYDKAAK